MLVQCTICSVSYDHARGSCMGCGTAYVPSAEEMREMGRAAAITAMERGASRKEVIDMLLASHDLSEVEIAGMADVAVREMRGRAKIHGSRVAVVGAVLLMGGLVVFVLTGGILVTAGWFGAGGVLFTLGVIASCTGWNLAGREESPEDAP